MQKLIKQKESKFKITINCLKPHHFFYRLSTNSNFYPIFKTPISPKGRVGYKFELYVYFNVWFRVTSILSQLFDFVVVWGMSPIGTFQVVWYLIIRNSQVAGQKKSPRSRV